MEEPVDPEQKKMPAKEERSTPGHVDQTQAGGIRRPESEDQHYDTQQDFQDDVQDNMKEGVKGMDQSVDEHSIKIKG